MTGLTDTYKEVSAQEQNKLLRQQIFLMHEMISGGERLEVEFKTALAALPKRYPYRKHLNQALESYDLMSDRFAKWMQDNKEMAEFYKKEG